MYTAYFGLTEKPFALTPDPAFLYPSRRHQTGLMMLEYGLMNQAAISVITGEIGSGKTTLIRKLLDDMDKELTVGLISNTHRSFGELLQWVLVAFGLECDSLDKATLYRRFIDFVIDEYAKGQRTVLIVDEAQNLDPETLEELRMLSNINADKDLVLQLILVGQPELRETLRRPGLVQFVQRISVDFHLDPLTHEETRAYIDHRIRVAGGPEGIFTLDACDEVYDFSGGVPRLINQICDTALVYAFADSLSEVTPDIVTAVAKDKQRGGLFPVMKKAE
ncbi:MAG: AAA family ATPase [Gammaproteobacteria bacterium]|nr:AAA family ATPase [Gammaproteobacteria bacterium]